jgi:hypothetical protein
VSNVQTKVLFEGQYARSESLVDGEALKRPVYFRHFRNGCYLSTQDARLIAHDLLEAAAKAEVPG